MASRFWEIEGDNTIGGSSRRRRRREKDDENVETSSRRQRREDLPTSSTAATSVALHIVVRARAPATITRPRNPPSAPLWPASTVRRRIVYFSSSLPHPNFDVELEPLSDDSEENDRTPTPPPVSPPTSHPQDIPPWAQVADVDLFDNFLLCGKIYAHHNLQYVRNSGLFSLYSQTPESGQGSGRLPPLQL